MNPKLARRRKLTPKQAKFIGEYVKCGNATEAAALSYDPSTRAVAGAIGGELLQKPEIVTRIAKICERRGLTEDWAVRILKKQGKAIKPVIIGKEAVDYPDNPARLTAAQTALKLHGHLKTAGVDIQQDNRQVNIAITSPDDLARLERIANTLAALSPVEDMGQSGEIIDVDKYRVD